VAGNYITPGFRGAEGFMFHTRLDWIMMGCLVAILRHIDPRSAFLKAMSSLPAIALALVILLFLSPALGHAFHARYILPLGFSLEALAVTAVLLWAVGNPASAVGRLLNSRPMVHLGLLSYSLYLWQQPFLDPDYHGGVAFLSLRLVGALLAAEASYRLVEKPALRLRNVLLGRARGTRAMASASLVQ
jgi:peptidoglycan/LPS O-acetylase OafA/YrhL